MATARIMTFNVENLFARFNFSTHDEEGFLAVQAALDAPDRDALVRSYYNILQDENRVATGLAIAAGEPDIVCLQEIDSLRALDYFHDRFVERMAREYKYRVLIEGRDPRGIDVAIMSKYKIESVTTHRDDPIWSRDCLEVDVKVTGKIATLYINHFKSMMGGRDATDARRRRQAEGVVELIRDRFDDPAQAPWVIVGDLNDYYHKDGTPEPSALEPLKIGEFCHDMLARLDDEERWTHYWAGGDEYTQLDYVLVSPLVDAKTVDTDVQVVRRGTPYRAKRYTGERFPRTGYDRPKASDHCPLVAEVSF